MAQSWSKGVLLVPSTVFPLPGTVAHAEDLLADDAAFGPIGRNAVGLGTVCADTTGTKPMAVAIKATDHPWPPDEMTVEATGPTGVIVHSSNDKVVPRGRAVPLRFRLAGDEPSGLDTAGWQIVPLQVDCADRDSMIASSLDLRDQAQDAGRPDRPQHADRPARGSRGSQDRGTKGGRSER